MEIGKALKTASDFEEAMIKVSKISKLNEEDMEKTLEKARGLARSAGNI